MSLSHFFSALFITPSEFFLRLFEQIYLVLFSTGFAIFIGIPLGVALRHNPRLKLFTNQAINIIQTIPGLALLTLLLPIFGVGFKPAIVALTLYALLPIVRNTLTGLTQIPSEFMTAADGLGFNATQRLRILELPLAAPMIMSGIRIAAVLNAGMATLAAFVGAGGLGEFINRGLAMNSTRLILVGAIPSALLALSFDFILHRVEKIFASPHRSFFSLFKKRSNQLVGAAFLTFAFLFSYSCFIWNSPNVVRIATKNFTEQLILGEIMAQLLEQKTKLRVERKFDLGSTALCHQALVNNEIDLYPEYTGTSWNVILQKKKIGNAKEVFSQVSKLYAENFNLVWLPLFGFENTQRYAVSRTHAKKYHLKTISDLALVAHRYNLGALPEYFIREDSGPLLRKKYGLHFKSIHSFTPSLMYSALEKKAVDVIFAFSTDGRIQVDNLVLLEDNKHVLPPYQAAPVARQDFIEKYPEVREVLAMLENRLNNQMMQKLNYLVDSKQMSVAQAAEYFLQNQKLI